MTTLFGLNTKFLRTAVHKITCSHARLCFVTVSTMYTSRSVCGTCQLGYTNDHTMCVFSSTWLAQSVQVKVSLAATLSTVAWCVPNSV